MPARPKWMPKSGVLHYGELAHLAAIAVENGIRKVRVTGGEPLVRNELHRFVGQLSRIPGLDDIAMTTNGILLGEQAQALKDAGLKRVTVSLDSLDPESYRKLTRRDELTRTLAGIAAAEAAGLPVKINIVVMRGINDEQLPTLADWGRRTGRRVRFIEFMPLEGDRIWNRSLLVPGEEIVRRITDHFPLLPEAPREFAATEREYRYADGQGAFGVIASVTRAFCGDCDRIRITADGGLRTCLFADSATDLRGPLRQGASDSELARLMGQAVAGKKAGHLIGLPDFRPPALAMNSIGG
jgi:cyclic pyranopterin phosphate synthase